MRWWWFPLILLLVGISWWHFSRQRKAEAPARAEVNQQKPTVPPSPQRHQASVPPPTEELATVKSSNTLPPIHTTEEFAKRFPGDWRFRRRANDSVQTITGGIIAEAGKDSASALEFAKSISPMLATGDYNLESLNREVAVSDSLSSYMIQQTVTGFPVYQGSLQVLARKSDGSIYVVNNRLRDITEFDATPRVSMEEGLRVVRQKYGDAAISSPETPQVFAVKGQVSQLAWIYGVTQTQPRPSQKAIVVSALDGRILYEEEHLIHD